jgi:hypothetical protein
VLATSPSYRPNVLIVGYQVTRVPAVRTNTPIGPVASCAGAAPTVPSSGISVGQSSAEKSGHQAYVSREWGFQRMQRRRVYSIVRIQVVSAVRLEERLSERSSERPKPSRVHVLQSLASPGSHPQHHCQPHIACWTRRCALRLVTPARDCDVRVRALHRSRLLNSVLCRTCGAGIRAQRARIHRGLRSRGRTLFGWF